MMLAGGRSGALAIFRPAANCRHEWADRGREAVSMRHRLTLLGADSHGGQFLIEQNIGLMRYRRLYQFLSHNYHVVIAVTRNRFDARRLSQYR